MKNFVIVICASLLLFIAVQHAGALGETDVTTIYKMVHQSAAGPLESYTAYSIVAREKTGYWLQRVTYLTLESAPLSITQTLLDETTHQPLRYLMHRPANMDKPARVVDLPLSDMGQDEVLPTPVMANFADAGQLETPAGTFAVKQGQMDKFSLWLSPDAPVMGVVKAETEEWTMELVRIDSHVEDFFPRRPAQGGTVVLED